ncbi:guanylate kinase [Salinisphaera sp. PC39]|uniref:guanylate kinase n=1 Tax=Salinisphaera sp. PC39 TaxID=1304156 RepID=UPI00333F9193
MGGQRTERGRLFVVSAPSGAGKTSLTRAAIDRLATRGRSARFSVSYTTRAPRVGERDGIDYHFVDDAEFRRLIEAGEFLEHARVFDRRYGTGRGETERLLAAGHDVILDIDWQGAQQVREASDQVVSVFIMPPSLAELERRLRERALDDEADIERRLAEAEEEIAHSGEFDHIVVNDRFEDALAELESILAGEGGMAPAD